MHATTIRSGPPRPDEFSIWSGYVDRFWVAAVGAQPIAILRAMCALVEPGSVRRCEPVVLGELTGLRGPYAAHGVDLYLRLLGRWGLAELGHGDAGCVVTVRPSIPALQIEQVRELPLLLQETHPEWLRFDEIVTAVSGLRADPM